MFGGLSQIALRRVTVLVLSSVFLLNAPLFSQANDTKKGKGSRAQAAHLVEPKLGHARMYFRRHEYRAALLALDGKIDDNEARFIAGESNFRLGNYPEARGYFEQILSHTEDQIERRKAFIRLFDIDLYTKDIPSAINRYVAFGKEFKKTTAQMRYGLGKALFDFGYFDRAAKVLKGVPKNSEYFMRARYILASLDLDHTKPEDSIKYFEQIEALEPVSVEDYTVRQLAILAQGRIYTDLGKEDLAEKAYSRVSLAGEFGEVATIETVRAMLLRASQARRGEGRFHKLSPLRRQIVESASITSALKAIERFRKTHEIDWHRPELLTVMASLYVESKRYEEARLAYQELIGHYRPIYDSLLADEGEAGVWPYFALDIDRDQRTTRKISMISGVPDSLLKNLPEVTKILTLRERIEDGGKKLRDMEERAQNLQLNGAPSTLLAQARARQDAIAAAYNGMVIKKQKALKKSVANVLNRNVAEAEFKRADLVMRKMQDFKKQQRAIHDYQTKKLDAFERSVKEPDAGGSS